MTSVRVSRYLISRTSGTTCQETEEDPFVFFGRASFVSSSSMSYYTEYILLLPWPLLPLLSITLPWSVLWIADDDFIRPCSIRIRVHFHVGPEITFQSIAVQMAAKGPGTFSPRTPEEFLGRDLLRMMNRAATPTSAFQLCVQLGLMKTHENLFAREAGIHNVRFLCSIFVAHFFPRLFFPL